MIAGLILAAGESSRMGREKALLAYRGKTFLQHILDTLREAQLEKTAVVLGHHADTIRSAVALGDAQVVINQDYRLGQTSSLQAGLRALNKSEVEGVVLCLVDHPAISAPVVSKLVAAYRETNALVVIPTHQGRHGHPVLIARPLFPELLNLDWGQGANTVIHSHRNETQFVEVEDAGILLDVDTPEDYRRLTSGGE